MIRLRRDRAGQVARSRAVLQYTGRNWLAVLIEVTCTQCNALIEAPSAMAGQVVACPQCNAAVVVPVPASAQIIEVHAEPVGEEDNVLYEDDPFFNPRAQGPATGDRVWGRNIHIERVGNGGGGCCLGGCLLIALGVFFAFYGVVSFFTR